MIVGLFPELSGAGGVQRAGRLTASVLADFAARRGETCNFLALNDAVDAPPLQFGAWQILFTGFRRAKGKFFKAAWQMASSEPSLVVALHPNLAPVAAAMKWRSPETRTVIFAHGVEVWIPLGLVRRRLLRGADLLLGPSADTVHQLIDTQGTAKERTRRLAWSLGPEFSAETIPLPASQPPKGFPNGRIVLAVGRWDASETYKGVDTLIGATAGLLKEIPDLHLVAVGGGTDLKRLQNLAQGWGIAGRVHFLPFLESESLWAAYDFCDVFALPSGGEGFGLVFLEAMSRGKPVIGGAHGGTPDIIEEAVCGFLVQHGDIPELTDRLRRLLTSETLRCQMGDASRQRVLDHFTYKRFAAEFTAQLEALVSAPR